MIVRTTRSALSITSWDQRIRDSSLIVLVGSFAESRCIWRAFFHRGNRGVAEPPWTSLDGKWRSERDSNPRYGFSPYNALAGRPLRPLGHHSGGSRILQNKTGAAPRFYGYRPDACGLGLLLHPAALLHRAAAFADVAAGDVGLQVVRALVHVDRHAAHAVDALRHHGGRLAVDDVLEAILRLRIELGAAAFVDVRGLRRALGPALQADLDTGLVRALGRELRRAALAGFVLRMHAHVDALRHAAFLAFLLRLLRERDAACRRGHEDGRQPLPFHR